MCCDKGGVSHVYILYVIYNNNVQIVVGTPGRLLDVLNRNTYLVLRELEVLVMDEGERGKEE